jgi:predicted ATPase
MISSVEVLNYKSLKYIKQNLNQFQILIGPNGAGKSTFLDVFALLQDILNEDVEKAVLSRATHLKELVWKGTSNSFEIAIELKIPEKIKKSDYQFCRYEIQITVSEKEGISIGYESLFLIKSEPYKETKKPILSQDLMKKNYPETIIQKPQKRSPPGWKKVIRRVSERLAYFFSETSKWNAPFGIKPQKTALAFLQEDERFPISLWVKRILSEGIQRLMLNSLKMREPCRPDTPETLQLDGSNLHRLVKILKEKHPNRFSRWLNHVKLILPTLETFSIEEREVDRFLYLEGHFKEGLKLPSWMLSDGTLRFIALTLLAYLPLTDKIYLIEEPENGIHPKALEYVYQSLSSIYDGQIFIATHSPILLQLAKPNDILCFKLTEDGTTKIIKGDEHPVLKEWRKEVNLGDLFASGIL